MTFVYFGLNLYVYLAAFGDFLIKQIANAIAVTHGIQISMRLPSNAILVNCDKSLQIKVNSKDE